MTILYELILRYILFLAWKLHSTYPALSYRPYRDSLSHCLWHDVREAVLHHVGPSAVVTGRNGSGNTSPGVKIFIINFKW